MIMEQGQNVGEVLENMENDLFWGTQESSHNVVRSILGIYMINKA